METSKYKSRMADMREHSEFLEKERSREKLRNCLKCDSPFKSIGNRICNNCKSSESYSECLEDYSILC